MAGIYIHIPFCKQKCTYCDFHFSTTFHTYQNQMIACIQKEIVSKIPYLNSQQIETIYFGGGTPSILAFKEINSIIQTIKENYSVIPSAEITLEANPDDINLVSLNEWKRMGINRLSIGLQSFRDEDLKWMNRAHSKEEALNCVTLAKKAGFDNISVDLIYGLPNFTLDDWKENIKTVLNFGIQHVSAYCLTVEQKTILNKWVEQNKIIPANEEEQSDQFDTLIIELEKKGIMQYEISNFSLSGFHSIHNSNYWKGKHYLGIGPSAHSFNGTSRSWNISNNSEYIKKIGSNKIWYETEILTTENQFNELILIGLRTSIGVNLKQLNAIQTPSIEFWSKVENMKNSGWMILKEDSISLTKQGKIKADYIASELFID